MLPTRFTAILAIGAMHLVSVQAHGILTNPKPDFSKIIQGFTPSAPCGLIDGQKAMADPTGMSYNGNGDANYKAFTQAFKSSSFASLKDLVVKTTDYYSTDKQCGFSDPTKTSATLPDMIEFADRPGEPGFYPDHQGPCELWCDDVRVMQNDNCAKAYTTSPAKIPFDKAKCDGKKVLQFVWLAVHMPKWQAYINCVGLAASAPRPGPAPAPMPTPIPAPMPAPKPAPMPAPKPTMTPKPYPDPTSKPYPTTKPTMTPYPTAKPTMTPYPTTKPTMAPTAKPTTVAPYPAPTPSAKPSASPAPPPPCPKPSPSPSQSASPYPTTKPTAAPTAKPTYAPRKSRRPHHHRHPYDDMHQQSVEGVDDAASDGDDLDATFDMLDADNIDDSNSNVAPIPDQA